MKKASQAEFYILNRPMPVGERIRTEERVLQSHGSSWELQTLGRHKTNEQLGEELVNIQLKGIVSVNVSKHY